MSWTWCFGVIVPWCCAMVLSHGAMLPCKCISLNNTSSDQSGSPTTTAGITQCHAAAHTCSLSSPTLSSNRDKQHEICCDSALHGPGLLQDRTQGWLAPSLVDEPPTFLMRKTTFKRSTKFLSIDAISKTGDNSEEDTEDVQMWRGDVQRSNVETDIEDIDG